jgi:cell division septation protein DedD
MTRAATQTQPKPRTATAIALERALLKQAQTTKANAPAPVAPHKPAAPKQPTKPRTGAAFAAQIAVQDRAGRLDLKKPASELAKGFGVDVAFLQAAMLAAGFVRIRRGVTSELFFARKTK